MKEVRVKLMRGRRKMKAMRREREPWVESEEKKVQVEESGKKRDLKLQREIPALAARKKGSTKQVINTKSIPFSLYR